jgi:hypothetical protein
VETCQPPARRLCCVEPDVMCWNLRIVRRAAHRNHPPYGISRLNIVCDEYPTTKRGTDNGTSIAFSLLQLYYNNQPTIQTNMIPMSSRRRAVVEFPIQCSLFVKQKALYSITGMTKFYIKSASARMVMRSQVINGCNRLSFLFYDNRGTAACASTIKIPDGWTLSSIPGLAMPRTVLN